MGVVPMPEVRAKGIPVVGTGNVQRITADTTIWNSDFIFIADPGNSGGVAYFQYEQASGADPADITRLTALFGLDRNSAPLPLSKIMGLQNQQYHLAPLCAKIPAGDVIYVTYPQLYTPS